MRDFALSVPLALDHDLGQSGWNGAVKAYPGITTTQFAMQHIRHSILKKFQDGATGEADAAALKLFVEINEQCGRFNLDTTTDCFTHEAEVIGEARDRLYDVFHFVSKHGHPCKLTWAEIYSKLALGNGANIGSPGTDFLSKVGLSDLSTTNPGLFYFYEEAIRDYPLWADVESFRHHFKGRRIVEGSRLAFVPKTRLISRTICTEPVLNMLFQKGIGLTLERLLRESFNIDLRYQPDKNRRLAQLGSMNGRFSTIDLSSASDSMSLRLCESMLPSNVLAILMAARSPLTVLPDGSKVELQMVSSMGNAYTFPLQTMFFTAIVLAAYKVLGVKPQYPSPGKMGDDSTLGNFAVFGDDIICVTEAYGLVTRALSICGFKVNQDKSFFTGDFRESCGRDYKSGHNVRGVYIRSLKAMHDQYSAINRLNRWSAKWCIPLPSLISVVRQGARNLYVPMDMQDTAGIKVPRSVYATPLGVDKKTGAVKYRYLHLYVKNIDVTETEGAAIANLRGWLKCPNPWGVLLAALAGKLRDGRVSIRALSKPYVRSQIGSSSSWDYIPIEHREGLTVFGDGWKTVLELNLNFNKFNTQSASNS